MSNQDIACKDHQLKELSYPILGEFPRSCHDPEADNVILIFSKDCTEQFSEIKSLLGTTANKFSTTTTAVVPNSDFISETVSEVLQQ
eukprot:gene5510-6864_t